MTSKKALCALAGAMLAALPLAAMPQSEAKLVERYQSIAGSKENAAALVSGLRDGKAVTLTQGGSSTTFTPATGKMGYGNVDNALALARASLKQQGIDQPTPAQLEGAVTDILNRRAEGQGWGRIADAKGFKLGEVKRPERAEMTAARPERPEKFERPQRPERPERPERPGKGK